MSRQFDVFRNPLRAGRDQRPYLVVVQHAMFEDRPSRVVVPLVMTNAIHPDGRLNPIVKVLTQSFYLSPTEMFTISLKYLRSPVANLGTDRDRIVAALDLVFTGI